MNRRLAPDDLAREVERLTRERDTLRADADGFEALFQASLDAILIGSPSGQVLHANPAACTLFRMTAEELTASTRAALYAGDQATLERDLRRRSEEGQIRDEIILRRADGTTFLGDVSSVVFTIATGETRSCTIIRDVTADRARQRDLETAAQKYRALFESFPEGITVSDTAGKIIETNAAAEALLGVPRGQHEARSIDGPQWRIVRPDGSPMPPEEWASVVALRENRTVAGCEMGIVAARDRVRWIAVTATPLPIQDYGVIVTYHDITERRTAQEALLAHKEIVSSTDDFISLVDRNYVYRFVNQAYSRLSGKSMAELEGRTVAENVGDEVFVEIVKPRLDRCLRGESIRYQEWFGFAAEGRRCMDVTYTPYRQDGVITGVTVNGRDITDIRNAQEALARNERQLHERNQILSAILDHTHFMAVLLDAQFNFIWVNQAYADSCRMAPGDFLGKNHFDLYPHPENQAIFERVVSSGRPVFVAAKPFEFPDQPERGVTYWDWSLVPVKEEDGKVNGLVLSLLDVTEQVKAEEVLRQSEQRMRQAQKMEAVGTLSGGIAHEFNNILSIIIGNAELASLEQGTPPSLRESLSEIHRASLRGKEIVRQLLSFSRPLPSQVQTLDLCAVTREALGLIRPSIPATIRVDAEMPDETTPVMGDATQIQQVIVNLCNNAVQAMETTGKRLSIRLQKENVTREIACALDTLPPGSYACLEVADEGEGIDPRHLPRVFDPFFTTKDVHQGSGMGLSVVLGILRGHGGGLHIQSAVGQGTRVTCYFPLSEHTVETAEIPPPPPTEGRGRILVLDDETSIVRIAKTGLERLGFEVDTFTIPREAVEAIRRDPGRYDVVITDLSMPEMSGHEVIRQIRAIRPPLPAILCTGYGSEQATRHDDAGKPDALLHKPFERDELVRVIREVLDARG